MKLEVWTNGRKTATRTFSGKVSIPVDSKTYPGGTLEDLSIRIVPPKGRGTRAIVRFEVTTS